MLSKLKISYRLYLMAVFMFVVLMSISFYVANHTYENLISSRMTKTKNLVETAISIIKSYDNMAKEGKITVEEAKRLASENVKLMRYDGDNYFWIYDYNGNLVMHPFRQNQTGKSMLDTKDEDGMFIYPAFISEIKKGGGFTNYAGKLPGTSTRALKLAYSEGYDTWQWGVSTGIYINEVEELYKQKLEELSFMGFLIFLVTMVGLAFISRSITKPLSEISYKMDKIAHGDLQTEIGYEKDNTEIGLLANSLRIFRNNIIERNKFEEQEKEELKLKEERAKKVDKITSEFDEQVKKMINTVYSEVSDVRSISNNMSNIAIKTNNQASQVAAASEETTVNVSTVASAASQLSSSIDEIARQVEIATQVAAAASEEAVRTRGIFENLNESSKKIGEVINLINDIADQTNLLALNATIEAARAGEAGKGFAVVANEVKNLANQTAKATEEISEQIASSQANTKDALSAIQSINSIINEISQVISTVVSAVKEQDVATKEIAENISQASAGTKEVSVNIVTVSSLVNETGSSASQVLRATDILAKNTEELKKKIDNFLNDVKNV
ncbi:MAG: Methyl-accepting chemotaxis protein 4 [Alphaproteobacteria bacterium ADurb.Bin438]|nr:MAG: Methyl-accepting chemotaxis protein 4 [Alphaproteobacteria bacterium ADurb.Bin438]